MFLTSSNKSWMSLTNVQQQFLERKTLKSSKVLIAVCLKQDGISKYWQVNVVNCKARLKDETDD
jgi:hypothetical protein